MTGKLPAGEAMTLRACALCGVGVRTRGVMNTIYWSPTVAVRKSRKYDTPKNLRNVRQGQGR